MWDIQCILSKIEAIHWSRVMIVAEHAAVRRAQVLSSSRDTLGSMSDATVANPSGDEESGVLQFLLGVAPLQHKRNRVIKDGSSKTPRSLMRANNSDSESERGDDPEDAIPVLEYTPEYESDDDYIELEERIAQAQEFGIVGVESNATVGENAHDDGDKEEENHQVLDANEDVGSVHPTILGLPALADAPELDRGAKEDAFHCAFEHSAITNNEEALSGTGPNCTDDDRGSGGGEDISNGGVVEIEEEPSEQPEVPDVIHKLGDALATTVKESSYRKPNLLLDGEERAANSFECTARVDSCSLKTVQPSSERDELESVTSNTSATDESHHEEDDDESCDAPACCSPSPLHRTTHKRGRNAYEPTSMPSRSELLLVTCVAAALALYVVASVYAFFHPILVPLPVLSTLQTPFDMSNVTVAISNPQNGSILQQSAPAVIEWTLADYPAQVVDMYGPEVFRYRVFVNDVQVLYEIGLLNHPALPGGLEDRTAAQSATAGSQDTVPAPRSATFSTTIRRRIAATHISSFGTYDIRVEVQFPIPGSEDGMQTLTQSVTVTKAVEVYRTLELLSPRNGSTFPRGESVLLEYKAAHMNELEIVLDGSMSVLVRNIDDGKFLLRGLGAGTHTVLLRGYDVHGSTIPSSKDVLVLYVQ